MDVRERFEWRLRLEILPRPAHRILHQPVDDEPPFVERYVGLHAEVEHGGAMLRTGQSFVLCSDGIWEHLTTRELGRLAGRAVPRVDLDPPRLDEWGQRADQVVALDLLGRSDTVIAVDVGTNAEVALVHRGRLYVCSAPAGPAFEGAQMA